MRTKVTYTRVCVRACVRERVRAPYERVYGEHIDLLSSESVSESV